MEFSAITEIGFETCDPQGFVKCDYFSNISPVLGFGFRGLEHGIIDFCGRGRIRLRILEDEEPQGSCDCLPYILVEYLQDTMVFDVVYRLCFRRDTFDYFVVSNNFVNKTIPWIVDGIYHQYRVGCVTGVKGTKETPINFNCIHNAYDLINEPFSGGHLTPLFVPEMYVRPEITSDGVEQWVVHGRLMPRIVDEYRLRYRDGHSEKVPGNYPDFEELFLRRERTGQNFDTQIQPFIKVFQGTKILLSMELVCD